MQSKSSKSRSAPAKIEEPELPWDSFTVTSPSSNNTSVNTNNNLQQPTAPQITENLASARIEDLKAESNKMSNAKDCVYVIVSKKVDTNETIQHKFSRSKADAVQFMEKLALEELKKERGLTENDDILNPLNDTVEVENIVQGSTIRYRKDAQDIIDLIKIERREYGMILSSKKREQRVIKNFQITRVESV